MKLITEERVNMKFNYDFWKRCKRHRKVIIGNKHNERCVMKYRVLIINHERWLKLVKTQVVISTRQSYWSVVLYRLRMIIKSWAPYIRIIDKRFKNLILDCHFFFVYLSINSVGDIFRDVYHFWTNTSLWKVTIKFKLKFLIFL